MRYISASTPHDMEIFLAKMATEFATVGARVYLDLYVDEPLTDEQARKTFERISEAARQRHEKPSRWRLLGRRDPLMGVELALTQDENVKHFSRLAHRVINAEAWQGEHQLFGTIESSVRVWVDMPDEVIQRALAATEADGATVRAEASL
ncbi:hypothetical protein [Streptomyces canus]|uniref:hypothetical protein n=1 Tax=Streptomyces canus TaxID=58343 RepID=UPI00278201B4|nr:hypothetical protein [Streptomyces canus]MDQ0757483.1 hypothetical protein [Streptomyces canus]